MALSRSERAYEALREDLLAGRWLHGTMLSTYALAEELGMSRTPVIDALKRLEFDGLVEIVPQVGCRVVGRTADEAVEALRIRGALEGLAAEAAAARITEHELRGLRALVRGAAARGAADDDERDRAFHEALVRAARQPQLEKLIRTVWLLDLRQMGELRSQLLAARRPASLREHSGIVDLLEAHEPRAAREAVEEHLRAAAADFERLFGSDEPEGRAVVGP